MKRVLVAGEINVDLVLQGYTEFPVPGRRSSSTTSRMVLGSASAIMAMGLARLGTPVAFVGRVGDDVWGRFCLDELARPRHRPLAGHPRAAASRPASPSSITSPRDRALVTYLGAISALTGDDVPDAAMAGFDHLHASSFFFQEGLRPGLPRPLRPRPPRRPHDLARHRASTRPSQWDGGLRETLRETDLFFPNEVELRGAHRHATTRSTACGGSRTAARAWWRSSGEERGDDARDGGEVLHVPAFPVETVDTTGAGDSFNAGFLHAWLQGAPVVDCLRLGAACGALSTLRASAAPRAQPDARPEAEALCLGEPEHGGRGLSSRGGRRRATRDRATTAGGSAGCSSPPPSSTTSTGRP